jgi:inositol oxygenase
VPISTRFPLFFSKAAATLVLAKRSYPSSAESVRKSIRRGVLLHFCNNVAWWSNLMTDPRPDRTPLRQLDDWDDFVRQEVYPQPHAKSRDEYRNYAAPGRDRVREFYRLNHRFQTVDFVAEQRRKYLPLRGRRMSAFAALEFLNTLVDDSDPDLDLSQLDHLLQTAEAIRADGHEDWFVLVGLLHDLGKVLCLYGEPQWAVVGDTFPVGCPYSDRVVFAEFFAENPDYGDDRYRTRLGMYEPGCGLRNVVMSWGHDEYLYHVLHEYLPDPALYMIRYHSFYAWHREEAYGELLDDHDRSMLPWVRKFNPYDLYSKCPDQPEWLELRPFYEDLIGRYLPAELQF